MNGATPRVVFLDRDGVIVEPVADARTGEHESPYAPDDVELVPRAAEAIALLRRQGFVLVGVSNQPAAAKGTASLEALHAVHARTVELLASAGTALDRWEYCFHHPDGVVPSLSFRCECRKPAAGMLLGPAADIGADLTRSWMVGDSDSDVEAGHAAGVRTVLVEHPRTTHRRRADGPEPELRAVDLAQCAMTIVESDR